MPTRPILLIVAALLLAGCEECEQPVDVNLGVGVGVAGPRGRMSVGQGCGPVRVSVGTALLRLGG